LWGKSGRYVGLTTLSPSCADCLNNLGASNLELSGPVKGCNGIALPLPLPWNNGARLYNCVGQETAEISVLVVVKWRTVWSEW
jgi:hypothetical protein